MLKSKRKLNKLTCISFKAFRPHFLPYMSFGNINQNNLSIYYTLYLLIIVERP